ncbi:LysR family transcriptional regulator [Rhizobium gallicum]|uniref:LysR family transcriptional regulator n=1 Tax=Rhizobium gallicum TaxID=56730 RepID=UPI001EF9A7F3|nr:LysR family transcriptional regulator [Rhizobium gallicum]ULJ76702.1 LysR family transcriptional regulator [Rhizobium gallicum]
MMEQIGIDRLTGIIAFARAASLGSYSAAARALSVSPSAISKSVQRLEAHLGITLFTRTTRSLTLTPEGRDLHERALRLLREAEEIEQAAFAARAEPAGLIKVTAPLPVGVHLIAPVLPAFRTRFPKVAVDLRLSDKYIDIVEEGIDVAIRVGEPGDSRLIARKLAPNRICAFAAPSYLERRGTPLRPEDLSGHDCVNFRYQSSGQALRWPFRMGDRVLEIVPPATIVVDNSDAVATVVVAGGGVGITPTYIAAPFLKRGELVPVLKDFAIDRFDIIAFWPESRRGNPNVKAFVAFLTEMCPSPTPWDLVFAEANPAPIASSSGTV